MIYYYDKLWTPLIDKINVKKRLHEISLDNLINNDKIGKDLTVNLNLDISVKHSTVLFPTSLKSNTKERCHEKAVFRFSFYIVVFN